MSAITIGGRLPAMAAAVVGHPVTHSLSPIIHGAWIAELGLDAAYMRIDPGLDGFARVVEAQRGTGGGFNITIPFKEQALALADEVSDRARLAGAANLLLFRENGTVFADNTDGLGMLGALAVQAPGFDPRAGPAVILGAGGAARGAAAALFLAGAPEIRIVNRTPDRAEALARDIGPTVKAVAPDDALVGANLIVNATSLGLGGGPGPDIDLAGAPKTAVVLDMVYKPLRTEFLQRAAGLGLRTVDGLEMLIRQAVPSFEAFFGQAPPAGVDVRALALKALGDTA